MLWTQLRPVHPWAAFCACPPVWPRALTPMPLLQHQWRERPALVAVWRPADMQAHVYHWTPAKVSCLTQAVRDGLKVGATPRHFAYQARNNTEFAHAKSPYYLLLHTRSVRIMMCFICKESLLYSPSPAHSRLTRDLSPVASLSTTDNIVACESLVRTDNALNRLESVVLRSLST